MIYEFAKRVNVTEREILGRSRKANVINARHLYWYMLYCNGFSYREIARLNDRARSVVYVAIRKVIFFLQHNDPALQDLYEKVSDL